MPDTWAPLSRLATTYIRRSTSHPGSWPTSLMKSSDKIFSTTTPLSRQVSWLGVRVPILWTDDTSKHTWSFYLTDIFSDNTSLFGYQMEQTVNRRGNCQGYASVASLLRYLKQESFAGSGCTNAGVAGLGICQYPMHDFDWMPVHRFNDTTSSAVGEDKLNIGSRANRPPEDHRISATQTGAPR